MTAGAEGADEKAEHANSGMQSPVPVHAHGEHTIRSPNEAGAAAVTENDLDQFDIFGEPTDRPRPEEEARAAEQAEVPRPLQRTVAACAGVAIASIMMVMVLSRRCLPSLSRLATILVVAGAQTGHALAPPSFPQPPFVQRHTAPVTMAAAAAMGAVAGSLLNQHNGTDGFESSSPLAVQTSPRSPPTSPSWALTLPQGS